MNKIPLTKGMFATVDDEDFEFLSQFKWAAHKNHNIYYATRTEYFGTLRYEVKMHRVIMGAKFGELVDHINGDGLDNRRSNLRYCSSAQNQHNRINVFGASIYKGVSWCSGRWVSRITVNKKCLYLGRFLKEKDAALAYNNAAIKYYGEFASLNKIGEE